MSSSAIAMDDVGPAKSERHPKGLYVLFATEMWERFSFYTLLAMLTLYLSDPKEGFGWTKAQATGLYANYLMFVYASPLIGGFLADRYLGFRNAITIGGLFMMVGHIMLAFSSTTALYTALLCLVIGNGFFKPNVSAMVGTLYAPGSPLRDSAYNLFYMGINVGATLAPIVAEIVKAKFGFHTAFVVAGGGMAISLIVFWTFQKFVIDRQDVVLDDSIDAQELSALDKVPERKRIAALIVIFAIVIVFWMVFHQNGSTMTYWADENTNWNVTGIISNSINPFWVVVLTLPLVKFWSWLRAKGREPSTPVKMVIGMFLTSAAFLILYFGAISGGDQTFQLDSAGKHLFDAKGEYLMVQHKVSPMWLISAYMVISLAELMLSPMGLSLVSKVAPARMRGLMMGGWFVATAIGNKLTMIGLLWTDWYHSSFWLLCASLAFGMAIVLACLLVPLKRAMPGV